MHLYRQILYLNMVIWENKRPMGRVTHNYFYIISSEALLENGAGHIIQQLFQKTAKCK